MPLNKKKLEILLQKCRGYKNPKVKLEQYVTPSFIAAELLFTAYLKGDIEGKKVLDLGCGTGIFAIGCKLLGAKKVVGIDIDPEAIEIARENANGFKLKIEWEIKDVRELGNKYKYSANTVVQNPPFGVRKRGADIMFLEKALQIGDVIYTMHKSKARKFILKFIEERNAEVTDLMEISFPLPKIYEFHKKERRMINVDIYRILSTSSTSQKTRGIER